MEVELRPGERGAFVVLVDGAAVFSKQAMGRFPEAAEIVERLRND